MNDAPTSDLTATMSAYAEQAVDLISQGLGHTPDFTPDSVVLVEAMAGCIHADLPQDFLDSENEKDPWAGDADAELQALCLMMGGYVGEVVRRHFGGDWVMEEAGPALPPTAQLCLFSRLYIDPVGWVRNRILLGADHNVFAAFEATVSEDNLSLYRL